MAQGRILTSHAGSLPRDWQEFSDAYGDPSSGCALPNDRRG